MKYIILYISLLFILSRRQVIAQCIANHEFAVNCGTTINKDGSPTFADNCITGWIPSHGTPQYFWHSFSQNPVHTPSNRPLWHIMYMWANGDAGRSRGEGIYAPYSFKKGHTYKIILRYSGNLQYLGQPSNARIELKAAQDIKRPSKWKFGNLIPSTTRQQDILSFALSVANDWRLTPTVTYIPDNDYNQFWIFPNSISDNNQFNLYADWISVCRDECESSIYYKQGVVPVAEPKFGYIHVGSSYGGTGTVTISPSSHTTLVAAKEIVFKPAFSATVTSGSFTARIENCNIPPTVPNRPGESQDTAMLGLPVEIVPFVPGGSYSDEYGEVLAQRASPNGVTVTKSVNTEIEESLLVYPNPSRGVVNIAGSTGQLSNCIISVSDLMGKRVYKKQYSLGSNSAVDLSHLNNGVYHIQLRGANKIISQKLVIIK